MEYESSRAIGFVREAGRRCRSDKDESCVIIESRCSSLSLSFEVLLPATPKPGGMLGSWGCGTGADDARTVEYETEDDRNNELWG